MSQHNDHEPAFPTWVLKTRVYPKRVIPKDGLVFEMSLLDGRFAIGFVLIAKFGDFRAPLTEILGICESDYDPSSIDQDWVDAHHADPYVPPICIEPFMFSKLGMIKRIGTFVSPVSECDIVRSQGFTTLDLSSKVFVPSDNNSGKLIANKYKGDMAEWEVIDCHRKVYRMGEIPGMENKLVVPSNVPLAGKYDLIVAQMIAHEEGGEIPAVERSKIDPTSSSS